MPAGAEADILKGLYLFRRGDAANGKLRVQLLGSGTIFREVIAAADILKADWGVDADLWSCPSFNELAREGEDAVRHNRLNPEAKDKRVPYVTQLLGDRQGPAIAATDYVRTFANQVREFVPMKYVVLGTDGFGRSDTRANLRRHFEVDRFHVAQAAVSALAEEGKLTPKEVARAIKAWGIASHKPNPLTV